MKTLEAGTTKYLLLDAARIERNAERNKLGEPIVIVLEKTEAGIREHRGVNLSVNGAVTLAYEQRGFVAQHNYSRHRAAYMTTAEVLLAETHGEDLVITDGVIEPDVEPNFAIITGEETVRHDGGVASEEEYAAAKAELDALTAPPPPPDAPTTKKTTRKTSAK